MDEVLDYGVGLMAGGAVMGLFMLLLDEGSFGGYMSAFLFSMGFGCIAAAKWRDVLQSIANKKLKWRDRS